METKIPVAGINFIDGVLVIDKTRHCPENKVYNVFIEVSNNRIHVRADKPMWGIALNKGEFDINKITEDSIQEYKPWPWSKPKKRSLNIVEYLERKNVNYYSDKWVIIEDI